MKSDSLAVTRLVRAILAIATVLLVAACNSGGGNGGY